MPSAVATSSTARVGRLRRRPDLDCAVLERGGAVLRLERRVRYERIGVEGLRRLRRLRERRVDVAGVAQRLRARPASRAFCASPTALLQLSFDAADSSQVTLSLRRAANAAQVDVARMATPGMTSVGLPVPSTTNALVTPGSLLDLFEIRFADFAADGRALLEHRVLHARHDLVDAEQRLAGDDLQVVDAGDALAEQVVVLAVLQLQRLFVGHRQRRGLACELAVAERRLLARASRCCSCVVHSASRTPHSFAAAETSIARAVGAGAPQRFPVRRNRARAAGDSAGRRPARSIVACSTLHLRPVGIELLRDDHREGGLHALADLRVLRIDEDAAVGRDAQECIRREAPAPSAVLASAVARSPT